MYRLVMSQLLSAVAFIHSQKIVHRDIKVHVNHQQTFHFSLLGSLTVRSFNYLSASVPEEQVMVVMMEGVLVC